MSIAISQVGGFRSLGQTERSYDVQDSREVQELLVRACTMKAEQVDGKWSTEKTGISNTSFRAAADKYRKKLNAMVGKSESALVYNWTEPSAYTNMGLKKVKISPAGFYKRLKKVVMEDKDRCYLPGESRPEEAEAATTAPTAAARAGTAPSTTPQTFAPVSTDTTVCRQYVAGTPVVLTSMDQQAIQLIAAFKKYKDGEPGQVGPLRDYIKWFDEAGQPAAKKIAAQLRVCGRDDLATQVMNKLNNLAQGINTVRSELDFCEKFKQQSNAHISEANKLGKQIVRDAERKKWSIMKKGISAAEKLVIPALRSDRLVYKEHGCGADKEKMRDKLKAAIQRLKRRVAKAKAIRKEWREQQRQREEVVEPPAPTPEPMPEPEPDFEPEPEPEPMPGPAPEPDEDEEARPGFAVFQNPWPWILGGAAVVFGVVAVSKAAKEKKEGAALPATAGYGRYRRY